MRRRGVASLLSAILVAVVAVVAVPSPAAAAVGVISSPGPLVMVRVSPTLNCDDRHAQDTRREWFYTNESACGTFLAVNGTLYGPASVPAWPSDAGARTPWTPVSQSDVLGAGTAANPYRVVTEVAAGTTGVTLRQTDRYVVGRESYDTSVEIINSSASAQIGTIFAAGDCYLQDSDQGYGRIIGNAPACASELTPGTRMEQLLPLQGNNNYFEGTYSTLWRTIGRQAPFPNTCDCNSRIDNAIGISWPINIPVGGNDTFGWSTVFSPAGVVPLVVTATTTTPSIQPGSTASYQVALAHGNIAAVNVSEVEVTLPPGFRYRPGTTTGPTRTDPRVNGRTLTFTGPFTVPVGASVPLKFETTASTTPGRYTIDAVASPVGYEVSNDVEAAAVTVLSNSDLSITQSISPSIAAVSGDPLTASLTARNAGPGDATAVSVTTPLGSGMVLDPTGTSPGCFALNGTVTCAVGDLSANSTRDLTLKLRASAQATPGARTSIVTISSAATTDPNLTNNSDSDPYTVDLVSDVSVTATGPQFTTAGSEVTYLVTMRNTGPSPARTTLDLVTPGNITLTRIDGAGCVLAAAECITDLPVGTPVTVTVVGTVSALAEGSTELSARVSSTSRDEVPANNLAVVTVPIRQVADLALTKTMLDPAIAGTAMRYALTVTNNGPSQATGVTVVDDLPAGVSFTGVLSSPSCRPTGSQVTCETAAIASGESVTFRVAVDIPTDTAAETVLTNNAQVTLDELDPNLADNSASVSGTVERSADLRLTMNALDGAVNSTENTEFELTLTNAGPSLATEVAVRIAEVDGITWVSGTVTPGPAGSCAVQSGVLMCQFPSLAAGSTVTIRALATADANPTADGQIRANASTKGKEPDPNTANNTAAAELSFVPVTGLDVSMTGPGQARAGDTHAYTIAVVNRGPAIAPDVVLVDDFPVELTDLEVTAPPGITCTIQQQQLRCELGDLAADPTGADPILITVEFRVKSDVNDGDEIRNEATATDGFGASNTGTDVTDVTRSVELHLDAELAAPPAVAGAPTPIEIEVLNAGPSDVDNPELTIIPGINYVVTGISAPNATCDVATLSCVFTRLAADVRTTVTVEGRYRSATTGDQEFGVIITNPHGDPAADKLTVTLTQAVDLGVTLESRPTSTYAGDAVDYRLQVTNAGPSVGTGVVVSTTLPAGLTFRTTGSSPECTATGQTVQCAAGQMERNATQTLTLRVDSAIDLNGPVNITATASSNQADPVPGNNSASATTTFALPSDLMVSHEVTQGYAGSELTWTIDVDNITAGQADNVIIEQTLPDTVTFTLANSTQGAACTWNAPIVRCELGSIPGGELATITVKTSTDADIVPLDQTSISPRATATVTTTTPDLNVNNNSAEAISVVVAAADLVVEVSGPDEVIAGTQATYTLKVTNNGPSTATHIVITDRLEATLTFLRFDSDQQCTVTNPGTNTISCALTEPLLVGAERNLQIVVLVDSTAPHGDKVHHEASATSSRASTTTPPVTEFVSQVAAIADIRVATVVATPVVSAGSRYGLEVTVVNEGPSLARDVTVNYTGPGQLLEAQATLGGKQPLNCPTRGILVDCVITQLPVGEPSTYFVTVDVPSDAPHDSLIASQVQVSSTITDPDASNNEASQQVTVSRVTSLNVTKTASVTTAKPGDRVTWTITATNTADFTLGNVIVMDRLPQGVTNLSSTGCITQLGQTVTCSQDTLKSGETIRIVIEGTISQDAAGVLTNNAQAFGEGSSMASSSVSITIESPGTGGGGKLVPPPTPDPLIPLPLTGAFEPIALLSGGLLLLVTGAVAVWAARSHRGAPRP